MSIKIMTEVFERYPNGGGEMLLALAISDHASDDGTNVYPSVKHLAEKTRQSERTIQYQLRKMEESGWLIVVADEKGGRSKAREYKINIDWIKGANIAPFKSETKGAEIAPINLPIKGATDDIKGASDDIKGASDDTKGAIAVAPESLESSLTIIEPSIKEKIIKKENGIDPEIKNLLPDVDEQVIKDFLILRKQKKAPITATAMQGFRREAAQAGISLQDALILCCTNGWQGFKAEWYHKAQAPPPYQSRQQIASIAARSIFGNESSNEKCIEGEVIEHESTAKKLG
ncbi:MAG: helix-turn-helix domain-containing protein [Nitrosomonas sp.]|uniref:helix-turn-helix domain-containing protein n=1 Tax=Nitrosomonas sp. TaxID=42353 RepID=UPI0025FAD9D6|nr:helix-turn-helix domain-containing protein [Nitrosomonas sp.]MBY0475439.1 helix-turn-helix domain-containing protein [Nitrosomonas sp.]